MAENRAATREHRHERRYVALRATALYLLLGVAWVLLSDLLLYQLVQDRGLIARLETAKGWTFVGLSAVLVYVLIARAVARLRRVEATMRAVVESIADGVLLVGRAKSIVDANPAAVRMLGVAAKEALVGMGPEEFCRRFHVTRRNGELVPPDEYASQRALRGETVSPYRAVLYPEASREVFITASSAPVRVRDGDVELVVSVMRDETEIALLERTRDEFFAAAAHSLKTPLSVIKGHAQLLARRAERSIDRLAAEAIDRQCGRLDRVLQNLIVLGRIRSGSLRFYPRRVDLAALVHAVACDLRPAAREHELCEEVGAQPEVFADPERLAQALRNVVEIGLQSSPPRSPIMLLLSTEDHTARVGLRARSYEPIADDDPIDAANFALSGSAPTVAWHISEELVRSQGGRIYREESPAGSQTTWIELPTLAAEEHAA